MPAIGIGISPYFRRGGGSNANALAYFSECPVDNTDDFKSVVTTAFDSLDSSGIGPKIDRLFIYGQEYQANAVVSMYNPETTKATEESSPTWTYFEGYERGTNGYINNQFNLLSDGVNYQKNNACMFLWSETNANIANGVDGGAQETNGSGDTVFIFSRDGGNAYAGINDQSGASAAATSVADSLGFYSVVRVDSTTIQLWKNGVKIYEGNVNSTDPPNLVGYALGLNRDNALIFPSTRKLFVFGYGAGDIDQAELYSVISTMRTSIQALPEPPVPPMINATMKMRFPDLVDTTGNGYDGVLGNAPVGFNDPVVDGNNDTVFGGTGIIQLNPSLPISSITNYTFFIPFWIETPETTEAIVQFGLSYISGGQIRVFTRNNNLWAPCAGMCIDEAIGSEPIYSKSLPKTMQGNIVFGVSFSYTTVRVYINGIVTYFDTNPGASVAATGGWFGAYPGVTNNNYTKNCNITVKNGATLDFYDRNASLDEFQSTGDLIMKNMNLNSLVFEGDSLTAGFTLTNNSDNWPSIVSEYLDENTAYNWAPCNIGIGGRYLVDISDEANDTGVSVTYNWTTTALINPVEPSEKTGAKNVYVLLAGINDIANGETLINLQSALTSLITYRKSQGFNCFVLSVTSDVSLSAGEESIRLSYNSWLSAQASVQGFTFIDTCSDPNLAGQPPGANAYFSDGVHYTALTCSSIVGPMVYNSIIANI